MKEKILWFIKTHDFGVSVFISGFIFGLAILIAAVAQNFINNF